MSMVDVTEKPKILREATATGTIKLKAATVLKIKEKRIAKGDPINTAKIAGILAAKNTSNLIPLCHPLPLTSVDVKVEIEKSTVVRVTAKVKTKAPTGVEMEALTATATALLTVWDMVKQYEKDEKGQYPSTMIEGICVAKKIKRSQNR